MVGIKLPRLKSDYQIVTGQGYPTPFFLRLFNIDLAQRLETTVGGLQAVQAELVAQLALIQAAQNRADEAYDLAETAQGSRYISFSGSYPTVSGIINNQTALAALTFTVSASGATLDTDSTWEGTVSFSESNGGAPVSIGSVPISISSNGLEVSGQWQTETATVTYNATGSLAGNVTYTVTGAYVSGANFVTSPALEVDITTIPRAS